MDTFLDIYDTGLNKAGEQLCGDQIKVFRNENKTIVVLSDGLGSGVKANILATLTSEIIVTLLKADVPLDEVIATVIGTLPICQVRHIAYATFTIVIVDPHSGAFQIMNFDYPPWFNFRRGKLTPLPTPIERIHDREIKVAGGVLARGDFLGLMSDGVQHAGLGMIENFGWGWASIAHFIEGLFARAYTARPIVREVIDKTNALYDRQPGDDATFVGIYAREKHSLMVLTGPPLDPTKDDLVASRLLNFDGRKVVCGGTTGNIVAEYLGEIVEVDVDTLREDVPPLGHLNQIDLVTEGIITMSKALDVMQACRAHWWRLPNDPNAAVMLARELLMADSIYFLVGQKINEFYQNPLLPRNLSIRKHLVEEIARFLIGHKKDVKVEFC